MKGAISPTREAKVTAHERTENQDAGSPAAGEATAQGTTTARPLYARPEQAIQIVPISRRTLSNWQKSRVVPFYRIGRCILFKVDDLERALERFRVAPVGEPRPQKTGDGSEAAIREPVAPRKRRAGRIVGTTRDKGPQP